MYQKTYIIRKPYINNIGISTYKYTLSSGKINCNRLSTLYWQNENIKNTFDLDAKKDYNNPNDMNKCTKINLKQKYNSHSFKDCTPNNVKNEVCNFIRFSPHVSLMVKPTIKYYKDCSIMEKNENGEVTEIREKRPCTIM